MSIYPDNSKRIPDDLIEKVKDRIVATVTIDENECWVWNGNRFSSGYGNIKIGGRQFLAHRVSSELFHENYDPKLLVLHQCPNVHNKACMNPWHLKQGTQKENMNHPVTRQVLSRRASEAHRRKLL